MIYGGLFALPLGLLITYRLCTSARANIEQQIAKATLICSLGLFAAGGILGFLIQEINVTIPAHYHGSIVGITLAFFGLTYYLLPMLGYRPPLRRLAIAQQYIYGAGQLLHIAGLAWSGGYGVQRKTAGAAQGLDRLPEIAGMAMMGLGGLIAIIGGILFVVIVLLSVWPGKSRDE
jgi:heme/copper-type cytochrome/quinol oxidase subunit 1